MKMKSSKLQEGYRDRDFLVKNSVYGKPCGGKLWIMDQNSCSAKWNTQIKFGKVFFFLVDWGTTAPKLWQSWNTQTWKEKFDSHYPIFLVENSHYSFFCFFWWIEKLHKKQKDRKNKRNKSHVTLQN